MFNEFDTTTINPFVHVCLDDCFQAITIQLLLVTDAVHTHAVFAYGNSTWINTNLVRRPATMAWQCGQSDSYYELITSRQSAIYQQAFSGSNSGKKCLRFLPRSFHECIVDMFIDMQCNNVYIYNIICL